MVEGPKYPAQQLTEKDKKILFKVFLKFFTLFYNSMQNYPNPKDYAKKYVSTANNNKGLAVIYTIINIKNSPDDQPLQPGKLNEKLANDITCCLGQDVSAFDSDEGNPKRFLHPRDLSEILKAFKEQGIIIRLEKNQIKDLLRKTRRTCRNSPDTLTQHSRGGKLSVYMVKEDIERVKRALKKPEGLDYLYTLLIKSDLAHELMKYLFLFGLHMLRLLDENTAINSLGVGESYMQDKLTEQERSQNEIALKFIRSIDDKQLEYIVDEMTKKIIHYREIYVVLFWTSLLEL